MVPVRDLDGRVVQVYGMRVERQQARIRRIAVDLDVEVHVTDCPEPFAV